MDAATSQFIRERAGIAVNIVVSRRISLRSVFTLSMSLLANIAGRILRRISPWLARNVIFTKAQT
jgi:hypothetical protein